MSAGKAFPKIRDAGFVCTVRVKHTRGFKRPQTLAVSVNLSVADVLGRVGVAPPSSGVLFDVWNVTVAQIAPIIPYLLLVLILIFRPTGLMGTREH